MTQFGVFGWRWRLARVAAWWRLLFVRPLSAPELLWAREHEPRLVKHWERGTINEKELAQVVRVRAAISLAGERPLIMS